MLKTIKSDPDDPTTAEDLYNLNDKAYISEDGESEDMHN